MISAVNVSRTKRCVFVGDTFSPETTTGGNALKFYASVRLDIRRIGSVKDGDEVVGNETRVKVVKNKVSPPFKQAEFQIMYGKGIYHMAEVLDMGVKEGFVDKSGAWYAYKGDKIGQGKANACKFLEENLDIAKEIEAAVRDKLMPKPVSKKEAAEAPAEANGELL